MVSREHLLQLHKKAGELKVFIELIKNFVAQNRDPGRLVWWTVPVAFSGLDYCTAFDHTGGLD